MSPRDHVTRVLYRVLDRMREARANGGDLQRSVQVLLETFETELRQLCEQLAKAQDDTHAAVAEVQRQNVVHHGRFEPPTRDEIAAHAAAGGWWLVFINDRPSPHIITSDSQALEWSLANDAATSMRWIAYSGTSPCDWPSGTTELAAR